MKVIDCQVDPENLLAFKKLVDQQNEVLSSASHPGREQYNFRIVLKRSTNVTTFMTWLSSQVNIQSWKEVKF